jgi:hypothetical protein
MGPGADGVQQSRPARHWCGNFCQRCLLGLTGRRKSDITLL